AQDRAARGVPAFVVAVAVARRAQDGAHGRACKRALLGAAHAGTHAGAVGGRAGAEGDKARHGKNGCDA
ncbi:hypothetical protein DKP78_16405, partial [Enterococcus faecium]